MKTKEQRIIEKQRELIDAYREYSDKLLEGFNGDGDAVYPKKEDKQVEKLADELSALESEGEKEKKKIIPIEVKEGDILIATDPCIMSDSGVSVLTVGHKYEVRVSGRYFIVKDDLGKAHWFEKDNEFFDLAPQKQLIN